jgi:plasmid stabilization system protein ParE
MEQGCHVSDEKAVFERLNRRAMRCACAGAAREYSSPRSLSRYPAEELARMLARTFNPAFAERLVEVVDAEARRLVDHHGGPRGEGEWTEDNERLARLRRVCRCWPAVGDDGRPRLYPSSPLYI